MGKRVEKYSTPESWLRLWQHSVFFNSQWRIAIADEYAILQSVMDGNIPAAMEATREATEEEVTIIGYMESSPSKWSARDTFLRYGTKLGRCLNETDN